MLPSCGRLGAFKGERSLSYRDWDGTWSERTNYRLELKVIEQGVGCWSVQWENSDSPNTDSPNEGLVGA